MAEREEPMPQKSRPADSKLMTSADDNTASSSSEEPPPPTKRIRTEGKEDERPTGVARAQARGATPSSSSSTKLSPTHSGSIRTPESSPRSSFATASSRIHKVPPAPPSTPASIKDTLTPDGVSEEDDDDEAVASYPVDIVENASALERAHFDQDLAAATPAPTKRTPPHSEDFSEWAVGDRYELLRILGRGSYGEVAQARDLYTTGAPNVAIKRITSAFEQEVDAIRLYREMHILRRLRGHECIIQLLDVVQPPTDDLDDFHDLYLVFEYVDTDLYKLIMSPQYLTTEHIQTFLYQMLVGLKFIHSASVIHRDLKPANILLNENCSLKICDFGLARIVDQSTMTSSGDDALSESEGGLIDATKRPANFGASPPTGLRRQLTKHVVTRWYRAPELILVQPYTAAVDIWSLGCIMGELLSMQEGNVPDYQDRTPLFPGGSCYPLSGEGTSMKKEEKVDQLSVIFGVIGIPEDIDASGMGNIFKKALMTKGKAKLRSLETLYPTSDPGAIDLLKKMLHFDPKERCTAEEALAHDFLKNVRRKEMEVVVHSPLVGPEFLDARSIDLATLKHQILEEVLCYKDSHAVKVGPVVPTQS